MAFDDVAVAGEFFEWESRKVRGERDGPVAEDRRTGVSGFGAAVGGRNRAARQLRSLRGLLGVRMVKS